MQQGIGIFSGGAHPALAAEMCRHLGLSLYTTTSGRFSNDCLQVQLDESCRERDIYLVQPLVPPVQDHLMELLLMLDAARGASAARVTAVIPHYAYVRSDKKDAPRISIGARLVADLLVTAGANRVLTMTLHSLQVHGFFSRTFPPAAGRSTDGHRVEAPPEYSRGPEGVWISGAPRVRDGRMVTLTAPARNTIG